MKNGSAWKRERAKGCFGNKTNYQKWQEEKDRLTKKKKRRKNEI